MAGTLVNNTLADNGAGAGGEAILLESGFWYSRPQGGVALYHVYLLLVLRNYLRR